MPVLLAGSHRHDVARADLLAGPAPALVQAAAGRDDPWAGRSRPSGYDACMYRSPATPDIYRASRRRTVAAAGLIALALLFGTLMVAAYASSPTEDVSVLYVLGPLVVALFALALWLRALDAGHRIELRPEGLVWHRGSRVRSLLWDDIVTYRYVEQQLAAHGTTGVAIAALETARSAGVLRSDTPVARQIALTLVARDGTRHRIDPMTERCQELTGRIIEQIHVRMMAEASRTLAQHGQIHFRAGRRGTIVLSREGIAIGQNRSVPFARMHRASLGGGHLEVDTDSSGRPALRIAMNGVESPFVFKELFCKLRGRDFDPPITRPPALAVWLITLAVVLCFPLLGVAVYLWGNPPGDLGALLFFLGLSVVLAPLILVPMIMNHRKLRKQAVAAARGERLR